MENLPSGTEPKLLFGGAVGGFGDRDCGGVFEFELSVGNSDRPGGDRAGDIGHAASASGLASLQALNGMRQI